MPDPNQQQATPQQGGAPPAEPKSAPAESEQQPNKDERFGAFQFKKLQDERDELKKRLDAIESEKAQKDRADAEQRGEYQKLYAEEKAKREQAEKQAAELFKRNALSAELVKLGVKNLDAAADVDLSRMDPEGKNAPEIAQRLVSAFGVATGKNGPPTPTPTPNPGGAPEDLSKVDPRDLWTKRPDEVAAFAKSKGFNTGGSFRKS